MTATENPVTSKPLPPMSDDMISFTRDMLLPETPESFGQIPGFPALFLRQTNIAEATGGRIGVEVIRANPDVSWTGSPWHMHHFDWSIAYITRGWAEFEFEGVGKVRLEAGTIMNQPPTNRHREGATSPDFEALIVHSPAVIPSTVYVWDEEAGEYREFRSDDAANDTEFAAMNSHESTVPA